MPIELNIFFNPRYIGVDSLKLFWSKLHKLNMWHVNDDKIDGEGCEIKQIKDGSYNLISDGGDVHLYLITKNEIKQLYFYAPDYYNEKCPGRKGRTALLELMRLFDSNFKFRK